MAEDLVELKPRPSEEKRDERLKPEGEKQPTPLPRWPFVLAGLVVAIFAAMVLYIVFRPHPDVRTDDAYVMVHYATIAPRISGQFETVPVDDNQLVKAGQVLATLDPRDSE